jgi:phage shock protein A
MGFFARLSELISANLNALLDGAEDPQKMLAQVVREMEAGLVTARQRGAKAVAAERRLDRELDRHRAGSTYWKDQAGRALQSGREDLTRLALARKIEHDDLVSALTPQLSAARQMSVQVKTALRALEARLAEARRRQRVLVAQHQAVQIRRDVCRASGHLALDLQGPFARFERLENRLADLNDELQGELEIAHPHGELETELADLETQKRISEELEALKTSSGQATA